MMMMSKQVKQDGENRLPSDCWLMVFRLLSNADLKAVSMGCKAFREISNSLKKSLKVIHPEINMLSLHLQRFSQLKTINLFAFTGDVVEAIREIGRSGISLESLGVATHKPFEELTESLRGWGSNLKALNWRFDGSDFDVEEVITNTFPNLEQLTIVAPCKPRHIGFGFGFESLPSKLKPLKKIHLSSCNIDDQFIIALSLNCALLNEVTISGSHSVSEIGFGHLLRNRPNLEALFLTNQSLDATEPQYDSSSINIENSISHAKALTSLALVGTRYTDKILEAIAKSKLKLKNLGLIHCRCLTVSSLLMVLSSRLTQLRLEGVNLTGHDIKRFLDGDVSKVTHIKIDRVKDSAFLLQSTKCPSLVGIKICSTNLTFDEPQLQNIPPLSINHKIQSLYLDRCQGINDESLKQVAIMFPNLKLLQLNCLGLNRCFIVTAQAVEAILKSCKHLTELKLQGFRKAEILIDEADDPELAQLNLEVLDLSFSDINDKGIAAIAKKCPRLVSLNLNGCEYVTIEGIKHVVQNIKTLTCLNLIMYSRCFEHPSHLLEWMLSTDNLASLKKIHLRSEDFNDEQRRQFLHRGCLLL